MEDDFQDFYIVKQQEEETIRSWRNEGEREVERLIIVFDWIVVKPK